jgi:AbrB family looped-hinge helix DNA binding protein
MAEAVMTSKGQVTVPVEVRRRLGLHQGSRVEFVPTSGGDYVLRVKTGSIKDLKGMLPPPAIPVTLEQMDDAIADGAAQTMSR